MSHRENSGSKEPRGQQRPQWPSVEEQLRRSNVIPGTKLEELVRNNQDFDMLNPEEAHDTLRYPPWLRVYWRKAHPETKYSAGDPSGGYPRVLERVYAWMMAHQDMPTQS